MAQIVGRMNQRKAQKGNADVCVDVDDRQSLKTRNLNVTRHQTGAVEMRISNGALDEVSIVYDPRLQQLT